MISDFFILEKSEKQFIYNAYYNNRNVVNKHNNKTKLLTIIQS